ncbi:MAG: hypothetical protein ACK4N4_06460 [Burkholderiales bacterium]
MHPAWKAQPNAGHRALVVVGTSLRVYPVAGMVPLARRSGARVVIVNAQPTPLDTIAHAVLSAPIAEVLPALCGS